MSSDSFSGNISKSNSGFDEQLWVVQIRLAIEKEEVEEELGVPVSIFNAPRALVASRPEAYIPQHVAIGPYHQMRPELDEMERYKHSGARRTQKQLPGLKFQLVVHRFCEHEFKIRSHYHRYLGFNGETLAWMMAVDAAFLLEFLHLSSLGEDVQHVRSSKMSHLVDSSGRKSTHNAILRDTIKLENQIPLFLLTELLGLLRGSSQPWQVHCSEKECEEEVSKILSSYLKEVTPFKLIEDFPTIEVSKHAHLLDLLYFMLVPKFEEFPKPNQNEPSSEDSHLNSSGFRHVHDEQNESHKPNQNEPTSKDSNANSSGFGLLLEVIGNVISTLKPCIEKIKILRPASLLMKLPVSSVLKQCLEKKPAEGQKGKREIMKKKISIQSASMLIVAGIRFEPTKRERFFYSQTGIFKLPALTLDANTEVILRNLIAYEASSSRGPMIFTRYTELMNGMIDTDEDEKLLRKFGIIFNSFKSSEEVINLWDAMSEAMKVVEVPALDKIIESVKRFYKRKWKVKVRKFINKYVFGSWQLLTFVAAIILLLLNGVQAFCTTYSCSRWLDTHFKNLE